MWEISNQNQIATFLLSVGLGAIFCSFYDIVRALRKVCMNTVWAINVSDILIWIVYAFVTFIFLITRTNGEIRGYVLGGELLGFISFRISLSKIIVEFLGFIFIKAAGIIKRIKVTFYLSADKTEKHILKTQKYLLKSAKKFLKNTAGLLYNKRNIEDAKRSLNETKTET